MKLFRALQSQGFGTRRECVARVRHGEVTVNGVVCDDPEAEVDPAGLLLTLDCTTWPYRCLLYTSPSPRDLSTSRMPSSA